VDAQSTAFFRGRTITAYSSPSNDPAVTQFARAKWSADDGETYGASVELARGSDGLDPNSWVGPSVGFTDTGTAYVVMSGRIWTLRGGLRLRDLPADDHQRRELLGADAPAEGGELPEVLRGRPAAGLLRRGSGSSRVHRDQLQSAARSLLLPAVHQRTGLRPRAEVEPSVDGSRAALRPARPAARGLGGQERERVGHRGAGRPLPPRHRPGRAEPAHRALPGIRRRGDRQQPHRRHRWPWRCRVHRVAPAALSGGHGDVRLLRRRSPLRRRRSLFRLSCRSPGPPRCSWSARRSAWSRPRATRTPSTTRSSVQRPSRATTS
jgi:hypothetical protein